jgi:hypothetical protein
LEFCPDSGDTGASNRVANGSHFGLAPLPDIFNSCV